jgi:hypothetical protein
LEAQIACLLACVGAEETARQLGSAARWRRPNVAMVTADLNSIGNPSLEVWLPDDAAPGGYVPAGRVRLFEDPDPAPDEPRQFVVITKAIGGRP